jgi:exosortase
MSASGTPGAVSASARALQLAAVAAAAIVCVPPLRLLAPVWEGNEFYGHAYAMPAAAALVLYRDRRELLGTLGEAAPPRCGALVAFAASALVVLAVYGDIVFVAGVGMALVFVATAYAVGGMRLARGVRVPALLFALVVPPPGFVQSELLFALKLRVTEWSGTILQLLGYTVAWRGNEVMVPGHVLFVADACSGLTSIVTLLPLSVLVAYVLGRGWVRRAVIVASVVPLALLANVIRVTVTVALISHLGPDVAQGLLHETFGLFTYLVGTTALCAVAWLLR